MKQNITKQHEAKYYKTALHVAVYELQTAPLALQLALSE